MTGFIIVGRTKKGNDAIMMALDEEKKAGVVKRITANRIIRKELVDKHPLTLSFTIVAKHLVKAYKLCPDDYLQSIFNKYAGDVMLKNGASEKDYFVRVVR